MQPNVLFALFLTLMAGLCTGFGSLLAFFTTRTNRWFLSASLGFSAGVMIYVSFVEIFFKAHESLAGSLGDIRGSWATVIAFFAGMVLIAAIDKLIPDFENPHEMHELEEISRDAPGGIRTESNASEPDIPRDKMLRMGMFTALAIAIHNFPEGLATFMVAMKDPTLGIPIAIAIALHNIPEGIAVAIPVFYATGSRKKAFFYSFLSGLAEPVGAIVGYLLLRPFMTDTVFGLLFASVAGIMVFISFDELLPAAERYGKHHVSTYGLVAGMAVMAISLLLMQ